MCQTLCQVFRIYMIVVLQLTELEVEKQEAPFDGAVRLLAGLSLMALTDLPDRQSDWQFLFCHYLSLVLSHCVRLLGDT
eukprot:c37527_g1_i1 orf=155-391(+)